jgi:hypothetical protein
MPDEPEMDIPDEILYAPILKWQWSECPVCHQRYPHSRFYKPATCLKKECVLAWKKQEETQGENMQVL